MNDTERFTQGFRIGWQSVHRTKTAASAFYRADDGTPAPPSRFMTRR
ncbi:MAG: hypothetical protein LBV73_00620 [Paraburkholderia sp.]|jgi:hypothetical protein|nr:hypothetical protein [Paraburkholderia sp.]